MAYNQRQSSSSSSSSWKATHFINLYLPTREVGKRRKLGAIPLSLNTESEKPLVEWLAEDPARVKALLAKLILEFQSASPKEGSEFDLSIPG